MSNIPTTDPPVATNHVPSLPLLGDQNQCWRAGRPTSVEDYLAQAPWLRHDPESLLDLIYNEIRLREERGEAPDVEEYRRRFPALSEELLVQFEVHRAMRPGLGLSALPREDIDGEGGSRSRPLPTIEGFEVLGELGRGAMGVVYHARHLRLNRAVAIKMILAGSHAGPRDLARFETEARAVARLQHPHIVQIHEIGEQENRPFVCLELVAGGSLARRLSGRPLPPRQAAELAELLARAVQYAHEQQIVHRDLKPANVLLAPSDARRGIRLDGPDGEDYVEPKITDFGLAKLIDHDPESEGASPAHSVSAGPVGTPPYMAPEQADRSASSPYSRAAGDGRATDVYALGAILYEMLTGRPPFVAATVYETLQQVVGLDAVPPRRFQPQVPRDLETVCLACLRKDPRQRYATALDLAEDLRRFLDGRSIRERPPSVWEPALKWARRRPAAAAWVVLGTAAVIALVVGSLYYLDHRREWARQHALDRYRQFTRSRDEALFQGTLLTAARVTPEDRVVADPHSARDAVRTALAAAGVPVDGSTGPELDPYLTPAERSDLVSSCYALLVLLCVAGEQPGPDQTSTGPKEQVAESLRLLDRAGRFGPPTRMYHLCRARLLDRIGDGPGAADERRQAEGIQPASALDYYLTGVEQFRVGDATGAVRSFREALRLQPSHFEARCFLAICSLNTGRTGEAHAALTACIGQRPDIAWPYLLRGFAEAREEAFDDAEADFQAALTLDDGAAVRYVVLSNRGLLRLRQGKFDTAVADLEEAVALRPEQCPAHVNLARAYRSQHRPADASRELDAAERLRPDLPLVHRARARLNLECHDPDAAVREYEAAIALESVERSPLAVADDTVECGRIRQQQKRYTDALAAHDRALRVRPDHALAHYLRGQVLLELGRPQDALAAFTECLKRKPGFGSAYRARGQARVRLGDFVGAVDDYSEALYRERDASILTHRGWAYFFTDAWKLAERDFDSAIRLDASPGDAHVGRGLTRVMLGDYKRAVADADLVLARNKPDTPEMMHNVACLFALAAGRVRSDASERERQSLADGYRRRAVSALRKALQLVPEQERFAFWRDKMRPDSALDPVRSSTDFKELDEQLQKSDLSRAREAEKGKGEGRD
jgi:serine/threonine protein kinase/tetratricopeptide (TPR) repeat protein